MTGEVVDSSLTVDGHVTVTSFRRLCRSGRLKKLLKGSEWMKSERKGVSAVVKRVVAGAYGVLAVEGGQEMRSRGVCASRGTSAMKVRRMKKKIAAPEPLAATSFLSFFLHSDFTELSLKVSFSFALLGEVNS